MESSNSSLRSSTGALSSLGERASSHTFETSPGHQHSESVGVQPDSDHVQESVRHADLWFLDGSVILRAENTLFRVHISQLSRHSAFFRDLFSLPQPLRGIRRRSLSVSSSKNVLDGGLLEGCPVVYLHDTAEDVGNLLTALYDGPSFGNNDQEDFRMVSGILRLSTKYLCDSLRAKALAHLSISWPSDLKSWDAREDAARYEMDSEHVANIGHIYPTPIAVINLAREIDAPSLLPSAFYDLSRYSYAQIFDASDEGPATPNPPPSQFLSLTDLQKLTLGKEASQQAITSLIQSMGTSQYHPQHHSTSHTMHSAAHLRKSCASAAACRKDFSELVDLATQHYLFDRERGCGDPLYVAEELGQLKSAELSGSECKACAKSLETWAARERERIWKMIPTWFRLEGPLLP